MTFDDFREKLLAAASAFKKEDDQATKVNPMEAFKNVGALAGRCATAEGLSTDRRHWDISGKCPVINAIMTVAYFRNHSWCVEAVNRAWLAVSALQGEKARLAA